MRQRFSFFDLEQECQIHTATHQLDGRALGLEIVVAPEQQARFPFNANAYDFLQFLRPQIREYGIVEFPGLAVNKSNYTLEQKAPKQHDNNPNPYMRHICQQPHQDTPPYPTAFWLGAARRFFATWIISQQGLQHFAQASRRESDIVKLHQNLVPQSLEQGFGLLVNQKPGLILIDNSDAHQLYHARSCNFAAIAAQPNYPGDTPMYAFNEIGLLNYLDSLDIYRGKGDLDPALSQAVADFMQQERLS